MSIYLGETLVAGKGEVINEVTTLRNIGEIVTSTIPLVDAGLHLLDGSQLVGGGIYDDFVTYIGGLYNSSDAQNFIVPTLTENGVLGGHTFAVSASSEYSDAYYAYKALDGDGATYWATIGNPTLPQTYTIYNPSPLNITNFAITTRNAGECATAGNVYGSHDGVNWTLITTFTNSDTAAGSTYDIDLSSNSNYYCYYKLEFTAMSTGTYICCNIDFTATCKNLFVCETAWQNIVTTYGACGKFVYDITENLVRLPKITGFTEGTTDITALGDLVEAGLPNITGATTAFSLHYETPASFTGALYENSRLSSWGETPGSAFVRSTLGVDASRSSAIYGNSTTVQPQSIKVLYYIVVATVARKDVQVDIDNVATEINNMISKSDLTEVQVVVESFNSGYAFYRIYSDGWCEQGGVISSGTTSGSVTFLKEFINANYITTTGIWASTATTFEFTNPTTTGFDYVKSATAGSVDWRVAGYIF